MKTTSNLKHIISVNDAKNNIVIKIRLNDECGNGHEDFSITATVYEPNKPRTERNTIGGGCCHELILKARPELKNFVSLHLADADGIPMHAAANMSFHQQRGKFDRGTAETFKTEFCEYYQINAEQFEKLDAIKKTNNVFYAFMLHKIGVVDAWEKQAKKGIKQLEKLTGEKFKSAATKSNIHYSAEEMNEASEQFESGYYTPEAIEAREIERVSKAQAEALKEARKVYDKRNEKNEQRYNLKKYVLKHFHPDTFIHYDSGEICFNWRGYGENTTIEKVREVFGSVPENIKQGFDPKQKITFGDDRENRENIEIKSAKAFNY